MSRRLNFNVVVAALCGALACGGASASLVYDASIQLSAQGFGSAPRDLTVQATGNSSSPAGTESGCVGVAAGGGIVVGAAGCTGDARFAPNGVIPTGGDEPSPTFDNQKYGIPTFASRGITDASQIGILFNATEPGGNPITVADLTLNIFSSTGTLLTSIDGSHSFADSFAGNGIAGFVFVVDALQQSFLNSTIFGQAGYGDFILSLNSTLTGASGGPESFRIVNLGGGGGSVPPQEIPEPGTLALMGLALAAVASTRRRKLLKAGDAAA